jgi:hypothetical protein
MLKLPTVFFLISFSSLAVLHIVSLKLFLYWRFWWLDIPMHFFGGIVVALGLFTLYDLKILLKKKHLTLFCILSLVFLVAIAWESYELLIGIPIEDDYIIDTLTDLCMGMFGGLIGYGIATSLQKL